MFIRVVDLIILLNVWAQSKSQVGLMGNEVKTFHHEDHEEHKGDNFWIGQEKRPIQNPQPLGGMAWLLLGVFSWSIL